VPERSELPEALRAALAQLAQAEIPEVVAEARAGARGRAKAVIEDALLEELLRAATAAEDSSYQRPSEPGRMRPERAVPEPAAARTRPEREVPAPAAARTRPERDVSEPHHGDAWWAYCIAADPSAAPVGAPGVEPEREVEVVQEGKLVALVSAVPLSEYSDDRLREHLNDIEWVERVARAHERVLDETLERATILPLRLCTLYRDQEGVRRMLSEQEPLLLEELFELAGRREWGAKVFVDQERLAEALVEVPEAAAPEGEALEAGRAHSAGAAYMARLGRDRKASERLQEFGDSAVQEIHAQLEAIADKARTNPLQRPELHGRNEQMWLNGAYLVRREREKELAQVADTLRERWSANGFELELTGPWPPYNFVSPSAMVAP
jgi:Gas vesicle synthesis protein GvpL/GvpF